MPYNDSEYKQLEAEIDRLQTRVCDLEETRMEDKEFIDELKDKNKELIDQVKAALDTTETSKVRYNSLRDAIADIYNGMDYKND